MKELPRRFSKSGPLLDYLNFLSSSGLHEQVDKIHAAVRACLSTPDGAILMELLAKSTEEFFLPQDADPRACDALNAQRFIALDLRRIMSDEYDKQRLLLETTDGAVRRTGRNAR